MSLYQWWTILLLLDSLSPLSNNGLAGSRRDAHEVFTQSDVRVGQALYAAVTLDSVAECVSLVVQAVYVRGPPVCASA